MGSGRGKGGDQTGAIAAGCGAIYCMVCFFIFGLPMLIIGIVLIRIADGDYDDQIRDSIVECMADSSWSLWSSYSTTTSSWLDHNETGCLSWEDWQNAKDIMRTTGIVLIVVALISLVAGLILVVLMFTSMCKKSGQVHQPATVSGQPVTYGQTTQVTYPNQPQGYAVQPHTYPMQPQAYPAQPGYTQVTQGYATQQPQGYPAQPQAYAYQPAEAVKPPEYQAQGSAYDNYPTAQQEKVNTAFTT